MLIGIRSEPLGLTLVFSTVPEEDMVAAVNHDGPGMFVTTMTDLREKIAQAKREGETAMMEGHGMTFEAEPVYNAIIAGLAEALEEPSDG